MYIAKKFFYYRVLHQQLVVSQEWLSLATGCTETEWQNITERFALTKDKLANIKSIKDIRQYPLYLLSSQRIIVLHQTHFLEVIWEFFQVGIEKNPKYEEYQKERSTYLEDRIARVIGTRFPSESFKTKVSYPDPDKNKKQPPEVDMLLVWGDTLLVFEAKSKRHFKPHPSEKGENYFYEGSLRDTLGHSFQQGKRFKKFIEKTDPVEVCKRLGIDVSQVKHVVLLSITLENLANFGYNTSLLPQVLALSNKGDYVPLSIDDLEIILERAPTKEKFMDYLLRRAKMRDSDKGNMGDEVDVFLFYLKEGKLPNGGDKVTYSSLSRELDCYYENKYLNSHLKDFEVFDKRTLNLAANKSPET